MKMERKEHKRQDRYPKREIIVPGKHRKMLDMEQLINTSEEPELSLSAHQELTRKVMAHVKEKRHQKMGYSGVITTVRDIVTCTDSFLIRASAYAAAAVVLIALVFGTFIAVSSFATSTANAYSNEHFERDICVKAGMPEKTINHISFKRSMEKFILSET